MSVISGHCRVCGQQKSLLVDRICAKCKKAEDARKPKIKSEVKKDKGAGDAKS